MIDIEKLINDCEKELTSVYKDIDNNLLINSKKVLDAFHLHKVNESHFSTTTGYGYGDIGREIVEKVFATVLGGEASLVRTQFISGTHALSTCFFGLLRPGDLLLSITGTPYDTIKKVIGIEENSSSLKAFGIKYDEINLIDNNFDIDKITTYLKNNKVKVIEIQRSKGYSTRKSILVSQIKEVIEKIREVDKDVIIMVDNCYCEFVEPITPLEVGADVIVGSLIKNLGAGIAPNGGYICGKKELVELASERLNVAGQGSEVGPTNNMNKVFLQGLFFAPSVVASALKTSVLTSLVMEKLGYKVEPRYNDKRADIVENIYFNNSEELIKYTQGIQSGSPIDSDSLPIPWDMPGYKDQVIMASGSFVSGSSIELSCDAPIREPYILYQQGSLTYEYGKLGLIKALKYFYKD